MATDVPLDPPAGTAGSALADWLETLMVLRGDEELSREQIRRTLSGEPVDVPPDEQVEEAAVENMTRYERRIDSLLLEVERRATVAPRIYPFRVEDQLVQRVSVAGDLAYVFLLWLSLKNAPFRDGRLDEVEELFDDLSRAALVVLAGPDGDARLFAQRYAAEPATDELRPEGFPEAITWLRGHLKLKKGQGSAQPPDPEAADGEEHRHAHEHEGEASTEDEEDYALPLRTYNDGGVDVVAWRHFQDGRAGFPVLLAQCTVQEKWRGKTRDVSLELWRSWIDFPTPPQKLLVIPFAIPENAAWWRDRNRLAGMILDRLRICELVDHCADEVLADLRVMGCEAWLDNEMRVFREPPVPVLGEAKDPAAAV